MLAATPGAARGLYQKVVLMRIFTVTLLLDSPVKAKKKNKANTDRTALSDTIDRGGELAYLSDSILS
jgi:hypothetical protein